MQDRHNNNKRHVVPRWRSLPLTPSFELESVRSFNVNLDPLHQEFLEKRSNFLDRGGIYDAIELINYSSIVDDEAVNIAAKKILSEDGIIDSIASKAKAIVEGKASRHAPDVEDIKKYKDHIFSRISELKFSVREFPRNAIAHSDLALAYTKASHTEKAKAHFEVAQSLAPNNRYIVRNFIRFLTHSGAAEEVTGRFRYLHSSNDPWILSALLSASQLSERAGHVKIRHVRDQLDSDIRPLHKSELAAALGTVLLEDGNSKQAKRLFNIAGEEPTENAHTQIIWANIEHGMKLNPAGVPLTSPYEAEALRARETDNWQVFHAKCMRWLADESFSVRASMEGSFVASSYFFRPEEAMRFAQIGLLANPTNVGLLNNLAFAYAQLGQVDEARAVLRRARYLANGDHEKAIIKATDGFISIREKDFSRAFFSYQEAVDSFVKDKDNVMAQRALMYMIKAINDQEGVDLREEFDEYKTAFDSKKVHSKNRSIASRFGFDGNLHQVAVTQSVRIKIPDSLVKAIRIL